MSIGTDISFFFSPKSIAIVGASPIPEKPSHVILGSLKRIGFKGAIYLVNPKYSYINGCKCYRSIAEIKDDIDVAIFALPAPRVIECLKPVENVRGAIIVSAGFKEMGDAGRRLEEELKEIVERKGIRIIGPNCLGIYDTVSRIDTFFIPVDRMKRLKRGGLSILTQSGSFAEMIVDEMASEGIGVARIVSYGNRVDVGETDCLNFLMDDEATKVIVLYIESVDDGRRFVDVASRCTKKKPVVAVKVGKREAGVHAARSHTGAICGRYEIYRAAFKKAGIIEVDGYEGLKDACKVLNTYGLVEGKKVLIVTDGGGVGISIADTCEDLGLEVTGLTEETRKRLSSKLPGFSATGNPIDLTGSVTDEDYVIALEAGLREEYDIVIVAVLWGPPEITERLVDKLKEVRDTYNKPMIVCSPGGEFTRRMAKHFEEKGMPVFYTPESAARAAAVLAGGKR
ncbi:Acetate--CoA ligase [ADP-forming] I [ANME-1 cluster archaeon GoMg1]|nr:Acetate--CoA ligase [ADP-forming] I [ANME-1 cluster archaeon GoMg1]